MSKFDRLERGFLIRMFFPERKIEAFYNIQPKFMRTVANSWDTYKAKTG